MPRRIRIRQNERRMKFPPRVSVIKVLVPLLAASTKPDRGRPRGA